MSKVTKFYPKNAAKDPNFVLEQSIDVFNEVIVIGCTEDGRLEVRSSTNISRERINWMIDQAKSLVLSLTNEHIKED